MPKLRTVRPKWVLTTGPAASLLETLSPLPRAMVGLALLSGLRRGELFALRWRDLDEQARLLTVREAVYEGRFGTPKMEAGLRQIPFSAATLQVVAEWRRYVKKAEPEALVFSTRFGKPISPNNILRRWVFPACAALNLPNATLAHVPAHVFVLGARQGGAGEGGRAAPGTRQGRYDPERVHAGARRLASDSG